MKNEYGFNSVWTSKTQKDEFCRSPEEAEKRSELKMFFHCCPVLHSYREYLPVDQFSMDGLKNLKNLYKIISLGKIDKYKTFQAFSSPTEG